MDEVKIIFSKNDNGLTYEAIISDKMTVGEIAFVYGNNIIISEIIKIK